MTTENIEEIAGSETIPITEAEQLDTGTQDPPWIYRDGYDQHYKVRYLGFTIDLDEWVTIANQKVG